MHTTWQAWVKAAHRSHDVDAFELVRAILFKDRCVLHSIFVGTGRAIDVSYTTIPGCGRIGMVVGNLSVLDDHVMGKHAAHSLMESTANGFLRYCEIVPCLGATSTYLSKCLIDTVQRDSSRIGLEVGSRTVTLNSVAPLWNLPLELHLRLRGRLG